MVDDPLAALDALERRYDGPIPPHLRALVRAGSARALRRAHAEGQADFFTGLAAGALRALRRRRAAGAGEAILLSDLALYRRQRRRWRRIAALLAQNEADRPPSTVSTWPLT